MTSRNSDGEEVSTLLDEASHLDGESSLAGPTSTRSTKATASATKARKSGRNRGRIIIFLTVILVLAVFSYNKSLSSVGVLQLSASSGKTTAKNSTPPLEGEQVRSKKC
jgi:hypothetical protein